MSTILDALKKSEQERKLNGVPTLSDMPAPQEPNAWPTTLLFVVIVLLLVLILVLVFRGSDSGATLNQSVAVDPSQTLSSQQSTLPGSNDEILVNVVSYSEQAEQSFVMINDKLYREGEFVRAGLKVEKIKYDQVVLNLRGKRITRKP